jgi:hypothetical protein
MHRRSILVAALLVLAAPAAAQELLPPQPGFTIKFRYSSTHGTALADDTIRVVRVEGVRSTAEVERASTPPLRYTLHSYRVWYSERIDQPGGTVFQDSPTGVIDEFAVLKPGLVRNFSAKLRYEADPAVAKQADGRPNRSGSTDLEMTYAVERAERVTVPAGAFDTFVLARSQILPGGRRDTTRIWYAPALRWWVKIENTTGLPEGGKMTGEAIEIRKP